MDDFVYITLGTLIALLIALLVLCVKRIARLVGFIEELNERVEESIDILGRSHDEISKIAQTDVASNDPYIRYVVRSIFAAQAAVEDVALKLLSFDKTAKKDEPAPKK